MPHKRYKVADDTYARLQTGISATTTTINIVPPTESWAKNFAHNNTIATLVQYGTDGNPTKKEKVYITSIAGNVLTVERGYKGDTPQSFNSEDYLFLNVVAEHIDDIHLRIDEVEDDVEDKRQVLQDQVDDIYEYGNRRLRVYRLPGDPPLQVRIGKGVYNVGGATGVYNVGTLNVSSSGTTYIMIDGGGVIRTHASQFNGNYTPLAKVTSANNSITKIELWQANAVGGKFSGIVIFEDTRNTNTTPALYNDRTMKANFKSLTAIGLNTLVSGNYARVIGGRGWNDSSGGNAFEMAFTTNDVFVRFGEDTWGQWKKLGFQNELQFGSVTHLGAGTSIFMSKGGFITVYASCVNRSYSPNITLKIQVSDNNTTWTDVYNRTASISSGYQETYSTSISTSYFVPSGKYVKFLISGSYVSSTSNMSVYHFL